MKGPEERQKQDSFKRAADTTVRGIVQAAEVAVPGLSILVEHAKAVQAEKHRRKIEEFIGFVLGPVANDEERARFEENLAADGFCFEAFRKIFEDEEAEKTWLYAALFAAFGQNRVELTERVQLLHLFRDLTCKELRVMLSWSALGAPGKVAIDAGIPDEARERHRNLTSELLNSGLLREAQDGMRPQTGTLLRPTREFYLVAGILREARKPEGWEVEPATPRSGELRSSADPEVLVTVVPNVVDPRWRWVRGDDRIEVSGEIKLTNRAKQEVYVTDLLLEVEGATAERGLVMTENVVRGGVGQDVAVPPNQVAGVMFSFRVQPIVVQDGEVLKGRLQLRESLGGRHELPVEFPWRR